MPRNIEIKARVHNLESLLPSVAALADSGPTHIHQVDTFFSCSNGRLKLRKFSDTQGELIFYRRADSRQPKESFYVLVPTAEPDALREVLTLSYGMVGRVLKNRTLFMLGRTLIHLDRVEGLGDFLELEVVMAENEPAEKGLAVAQEILNDLAIAADQLVPGAYIDLLKKETYPTPFAGATQATLFLG